MRSTLVAALVARAEDSLRPRVRRFVRGLSYDELQFIASFLGACILESTGRHYGVDWISGGCARLSRRNSLDWPSEDRDLKMIILAEYLCRSGIEQVSIPVRSQARSGYPGCS